MDFEEIKKLLELGGGKCAVYREGEPGYIILSVAEFQKFIGEDDRAAKVFKNDSDSSQPIIDDEIRGGDFQDFQVEESSFDAIKIEDLPL